MEESMIKLIASDVDGTLLRGGEDTPLPTALPELILRLKEKGIFFVAASGRQYPNLRRVFGPVQERSVTSVKMAVWPFGRTGRSTKR